MMVKRLRLASITGTIRQFSPSFWAVWLSVLLDWSGKFIDMFLALYLATDIGLDVAQTTLVVTANSIGSIPASYIGGVLADRFGRKPVTVIGYLLTAGILMVLPLARDFNALIVGFLLLGFIARLNKPAVYALIADVVGAEQRKQAFGLVYWAINIGAAIALPLAGRLATLDYTWLFVGDALTNALAGVVIGLFVTAPRVEKRKNEETIRPVRGAVFRDVLFLNVIFLVFLFASIFFQTRLALPLALSERGITEDLYGTLMAINPLVIVILQIPLAQFTKRFFGAYLMAVGGLLLGSGYGLMGLATTLPVYGVAIVVFSLGEMLFFPTAQSLVADIAPPERRGQYLGVLLSVWGPLSFVGVALGGTILNRFGGDFLWPVFFGVGCAVAVGFVLIARWLRQRTAQTASAVVPEAA